MPCVYLQVAALSGDARRALDICRRATEIAEEGHAGKKAGYVVMSHVDAAVQEMFSSPKIVAMRSVSTAVLLVFNYIYIYVCACYMCWWMGNQDSVLERKVHKYFYGRSIVSCI